MSKKAPLHCPICMAELDHGSFVCPDQSCKTDLRKIGKSQRANPEHVMQCLLAHGMYRDKYMDAFVVPGDYRTTGCPIASLQTKHSRAFKQLVCKLGRISLDSFTQDAIDALLADLFLEIPKSVPDVSLVTTFPYFTLIDDKLAFPVIDEGRPGSRIVPWAEDAYYYNGPPFTIQSHGGLFEKFLASTRCVDDENRAALRAWCYGTTMRLLVPAGRAPALLLAATDNGVGKTTTAVLLAKLFGGYTEASPYMLTDDEGANRQLMDPFLRCVLCDNIRARAGQPYDDSRLAKIITREVLSVRLMYHSVGRVSKPNYLSFLLTANQPMFSYELFTRTTPVTLSIDVPIQAGWESYWHGKRQELLEDLLWEVQQGWAKGQMPPPPNNYRFPDWYMFVARALSGNGHPYPLVPKQTVLLSPTDVVLDLVMPADADSTPLDQVVEQIRSGRGAVRDVAHQRSWTEEMIIRDLAEFSTKYEVIQNGAGRLLKRKA